jgi:hypothetical protein
MSPPLWLIVIDRVGYYLLWPLLKLIQWRHERRWLGLQLRGCGYELRRWESNKTRRRRLRYAVTHRPFFGSVLDYKNQAGAILGVAPEKIRVESSAPGCVRVIVPRRTRAGALRTLAVDLRHLTAAGCVVSIERAAQ